ncbi:LysM peptidoglycan-binding domain-containing protein [Pseudogracilibacillus auburnensis]|uniref:LysM domain-containing protein n=1 Tax=Pseudogracilibacillus auburnensis TaxID=1494959 RepID=A0A2V3W1R4_9BACI|nr:LysM domain-containing protein [Pseudogracilibacillus auburnensis]MBO1003015.1 LysM peptidoglycan-binding domain-containing protein [Pseudogracilibacillus auburnensis]PXW87114.1 LysM domain-containing protein [Pseudogracilibacillus auburnensis]
MYNPYHQCRENQYPYVIQPGDTLQFIANKLEVVLSRIIAANPGIDPYNLIIGQIICIPACPPNHIAYIIQQGDTLYRIAQDFNVTIASILEANPSVDPNYLRVAQRICIPSACATSISDQA